MKRAELLALTPERYLQQGFRTADGGPRSELLGEWAAAASLQLQEASVDGPSLEPHVTAVAEAARPAPDRPFADRVYELRIAARGSPFIVACVQALRDEADVAVMLQHLAAVQRVLSLSEAAKRLRPK